jgi:hypothetical protein
MGATRAAAAVLVAVAAVAACSDGESSSPPSFTVPTRPHDPRFPEGVIGIEGSFIEGTLEVEDGCLGVRSGGFTVVLWPEGVSARGDTILAGDERFEVGDPVFVGGGGHRADSDAAYEDPEVAACLEATGTRNVWVGGFPGHR